MADTSGQAEIRGINIDKLAKGFAEEAIIFKKYVGVTSTSNREIRWYIKTSGFLDSTDTTGITDSQLENVAPGALPDVVEQSWTRRTSYTRKYFVESPWLTIEDIKDNDVNILATNLKDLTRAVSRRVDNRIYSQLSGSLLLSGSGTASWGDTTSGNPILDLLSGSTEIRKKSYDISNLVVLIHPEEYKNLMNYLIVVKGSSIPGFSSGKVESGVLLTLLGQRIVVSDNCTRGLAIQLVPKEVATWRSFVPMSAVTKEEPGIGTKIRVWEEGEITVDNPNAGFVINTIA